MGAYYSRAGSYSRSYNAEVAEDEGRCPMSRAKKIVAERHGCSQTVAAAALELLHDGEWHHVGKYANCVNYYNAADERLAGVIAHIMACGGAKKWRERRESQRRQRVGQWQMPRFSDPGRIVRMLERKRDEAWRPVIAAEALTMLTAEEIAIADAIDANLRHAGFFSMGTAAKMAEFFTATSYTSKPDAAKAVADIRGQIAHSRRWASEVAHA